jgi:hypothetical protein
VYREKQLEKKKKLTMGNKASKSNWKMSYKVIESSGNQSKIAETLENEQEMSRNGRKRNQEV